MTYHIEIIDGESVGYKYHHICKKCGRAYEVIEYEQTPGCRDMEDEVCPHCGHVNRQSMTYEFLTSKI